MQRWAKFQQFHLYLQTLLGKMYLLLIQNLTRLLDLCGRCIHGLMLIPALHQICQSDNNDNENITCQPGLGACGASLSLPGRLDLSDLREGLRQMVSGCQSKIATKALVKMDVAGSCTEWPKLDQSYGATFHCLRACTGLTALPLQGQPMTSS